ncbi:MAG: ABC-F family ATP-binding cassette domain-containing protein [Deltaproteobacteria bacterium]|nr:ABC-F family ATP-binding cassette domain-containing protein [Deltaproteobacteria bacterium]
MIAFSSVHKQYGRQVLFSGASFQIDPGDKIGLVGPNGAGKSTIFRLIEGTEHADKGSVERPKRLTLGIFRQDVGDWTGKTVLEQVIEGAGEVGLLATELAELEPKLSDPDAADFNAVLERYGDVQERFAMLGGYDLDARAAQVLAGLGLNQEQIAGDIGALSGGWKMRVALAQVLLMNPDVMLLDEPTNHLDIESILWLEDFLRDTKSTVVMTCHDRDVMNRVVKRIIEIDSGQLRTYTGDYDFYEKQRGEANVRQAAEYKAQQAMLAKEERFIERFKGQPSKSSAVQSRARMLEKIERVDAPKKVVEQRFTFPEVARSGDEVIEARDLVKAYGAKRVHEGLDLSVRRGERWAVMGENGSGKSTLISMLAGVLAPDSGGVKIGASVDMAHFAQQHADNLTGRGSVMQELETRFPMAGQGVLRQLAGAFSFRGDDVDKRVSVLSGGEKTRLALAILLFGKPNLLLLDEPTNHLDLGTKNALLKALESYQGTIVFVSHDRSFLRALATKVLELRPGDPLVYPGSYIEYVESTGREAPGMRAIDGTAKA